MAALAQVTKSPYAASFAELLEALRTKAGLSRNRLAIEAHCDPSFLTRIALGQRDPPRRHIVDSLMGALRLCPSDRNRLLASAGFVPEAIEQAGGWDECVEAVTGVLMDFTLTEGDREEFRATVTSIARRWRGR